MCYIYMLYTKGVSVTRCEILPLILRQVKAFFHIIFIFFKSQFLLSF